ncbi:MAG: NADPH:quinone oxidoreductase [Sneathiella sp.]|jgi:NADPH2:quinone reductase|uniref:NADPH:quinone oxidoreductase family protein n=1 Tax=Sneathiella sp. TaxID=1964365 RepID=UPI000C576DA9|nr:NADPH:quinone oxidoreductase family protein [Sneathiella sp.]MAL77972.1 NADPH:quinone oxidoreductase [Sneathiella sp.]
MMRALICSEDFSGPAGLKTMEVSKPVPGAGEVLIEVMAAGVCFADMLMSRNKHQNKHQPPFSTGMEVAGTVAAIGSGVEGFAVGDRVAALVYDGGHAEYVCAKVTEIFPLPERCDPVQAAALLSVALTSELALVEKGQLRAGETVLIGGAAGGVGISGIQLAKYHGGRVIAVVSDEAKRDACLAAGADAALLYSDDLRAAVQAVNDGRDVDIVLDPVGGDFADQAANCLDWNGRYLIIGFAAGGIPKFAANRLLVKNRAAIGMVLGYYRWRDPARLKVAATAVLAAIGEGALNAPVDLIERLEDIPAAMEKIESRRMIGKAVVRLR